MYFDLILFYLFIIQLFHLLNCTAINLTFIFDSRLAPEPKLLPQEEVTYAEPVLIPANKAITGSPKGTLRKGHATAPPAETMFQFADNYTPPPRDPYAHQRGRDNFGTLRSHQDGFGTHRGSNRNAMGDGYNTTRSVKKVYLWETEGGRERRTGGGGGSRARRSRGTPAHHGGHPLATSSSSGNSSSSPSPPSSSSPSPPPSLAPLHSMPGLPGSPPRSPHRAPCSFIYRT